MDGQGTGRKKEKSEPLTIVMKPSLRRELRIACAEDEVTLSWALEQAANLYLDKRAEENAERNK
jgi:molybdopterin-guanine dinucleotide biosynthesis protein A